MKQFKLLGAVLLAVGLAATVQAQATRTWVSGVGDDVNPCSRTAPCKTWAGAISKTAVGGEIDALDPGGFGTVTITKSITLNGGEGQVGSILATGTTAVSINAANGVVTLKNIEINGGVTGLHGVRIFNALAVNIEHCEIYNFQQAGTSRGVSIENGAGVNVKVRIANSQIFDNAFFGVTSQPTGGGTVALSMDTVAIFNTGQSALNVKNDTKASVRNCTFTENGGAGIFAEQTTAEVNAWNTTMANNQFGLFVGNAGSPTVRIFGCQITDNTGDGIHLVTGSVLTHQNNAIQGNSGSSATTMGISTQ